MLDDQGVVWTAVGHIGSFDVQLSIEEYFTTPDCTGTSYVPAWMMARVPFVVIGNPTIRILPDAPVIQQLQPQSRRSGGSCATYAGGSLPLVDIATTVEVVEPAKLFEPPLHPEWVP